MGVLHQRVLEAKEERSAFQQQLLKEYSLPVVSLTLNLPGGYEDYENWDAVFEKAIKPISKDFCNEVQCHHYRLGKWGPEGFWVVDIPIERIKKKTMKIEETHLLGRIFDIDVINKEGKVLSRRDFSVEGRPCLVCDKPALECYRGQRHELSKVQEKIKEIINKGLSSDE